MDNFFAQFNQEVTTTMYVADGKEYFLLLNRDDTHHTAPYKTAQVDLGVSAVDFAYDDHTLGYVLKSLRCLDTPLLQVSSHSQSLMDSLNSLVKCLYKKENLHPYYYPLLAAIINLQKIDGVLSLEHLDYLSHMATDFLCLYETIRKFLDVCTLAEDRSQAALNFYYAQLPQRPELLDIALNAITPKEPSDHRQIIFPTLVLHPKTATDIWHYCLPKYLNANLDANIRRCENCSKCFVTTGAGNPKYCDRIVAGTNKNCRQFVVKEKIRTKNSTPINAMYLSAYKTLFSRIKAQTMTKEQFHSWAKLARQVRDKCEQGIITKDDFAEWIAESKVLKKYN